MPRSQGGPDSANNKRAAHRYCNEEGVRALNRSIGPLSIGSRLMPEVAAALQQMQKGET